jgi:hypothetical protein
MWRGVELATAEENDVSGELVVGHAGFGTAAGSVLARIRQKKPGRDGGRRQYRVLACR